MTAADPAHVAEIVRVYTSATDAQRADGATWYGRAGEIVHALASWSGAEPARVAAALAALSPRNPWRWNVQDCAAYSHAAMTGGPMPGATTFGVNRARAWGMLTGTADWTTSAPKVRAFVRAIMGDASAVVVDVWAVRVATAGARDEVRSDADYDALAAAYRTAAEIVGETPREVQAITWLAAQSAGTGSNRRGRHDRSLKRGTLPIVADLLTGQSSLWPTQ